MGPERPRSWKWPILAATGVIALHFGGEKAVQAYTPTVMPNGVSVRWQGAPKLQLAGNPTNQCGITQDEFFTAMIHGLERWNQASSGSVGFDYWQGTDPAIYEPDSNFNGLSSVYFASNAKSDPHLSPNVLGLTQVWYNTDTGKILETDIVLNDRDFEFTTDERDTSGYGSGESPALNSERPKVFIENVVTHEIGHAYGLSHSGGLQSTMLFMESPEQAHLGCDEQTAIRALYPAADASMRGKLSGHVRSPQGAMLFGAHVEAISRRRGTVVASAISDKQGKFDIEALEPGEYFLMIEPFLAGSAALPTYYASVKTDVCSHGSPFARTFLTTASGGQTLLPVAIHPGQTTTTPDLTVQCTENGQAAASEEAARASPPQITVNGGGFGAVGLLSGSGPLIYRLSGVAGHLELHAVAYSLFSPVHASIELYTANGAPVANQQRMDPVYKGDSGYVNYDSELIADELPAGDYFAVVSGSALGNADYPGGPVLVDGAPFAVVTGSLNEPAPELEQGMPFNARCRLAENFTAYTSPPGNPPRQSTSDNTPGTGFCGTVESNTPSGGKRGGGAGTGAIVGWFLPWIAMLAAAGVIRRRSRLARGAA